MPEERTKLSRLDRYFLSNQLRILEALYPEEADGIAVRREALEQGYEMLYTWNMDYIYDGDDLMTAEESSEVWDTLDMFDAISRSVERIGKAEIQEKPFAKFQGYDGNNESKFMAFAAFTVERLKRFEYVPMQREGHWNSHAPVREIYKRMMAEWQKVPRLRQFELTEDELTEILGAAIHPEHRDGG